MPRPYVRPNLNRFASQVAARLPGTWSTRSHGPDPLDHDPYRDTWDSQLLDWAICEYRPARASVLAGPAGERLLLIAHPLRDGEFIVGALAPPGLAHEAVGDVYAPLAVAVPADAVRAAAVIARRFLPRWQEAVARIQLPALACAIEGAEQAEADWDAVSDSLCDNDGQPLDEHVYGERKSQQRDAPAWHHLETFLFHGPAALADARATVRGLGVEPDLADRWRWRLGALQKVLEGGLRVHAEWELTRPKPGRQPGDNARDREAHADAVAERDAEGWCYASEFIAHGPVLLEIARAAATPQESDPARASVRAEAARARSTTPASGARPADLREPPPSLPSRGAGPGPRTR